MISVIEEILKRRKINAGESIIKGPAKMNAKSWIKKMEKVLGAIIVSFVLLEDFILNPF